jgi:uncharacterized membrane protein YfcA
MHACRPAVDIGNILVLLLMGSISGLLAGFFGVGGGIVLIPFLLYYFQSTGVTSLVATHLTFGTSLMVIVFSSLAASYQFYRNGQVIWRAVLIIGLTSAVGAFGGSMLAGALEGKTLQRIFAVLVIVAALRLLVEARKPRGKAGPNLAIPGLAGTGLAVGLASSLAGIGGGAISIPIMYTILRFPLKRAIGTSSATIVITALASVIGYIVGGWGNPLLPGGTVGYVDVLHALPIILGTVPSASLGAHLAEKTSSSVLKKVFGIFLLVVAARMLFL